jgi:hypothetical protein
MANPASTKEALGKILDGLGYLAAADPTALAAGAQAECHRTKVTKGLPGPEAAVPLPDRADRRIQRLDHAQPVT